MSRPTCAVFSFKGLGDGLATLVLSNNCQLNGFDVTTFHDNKLSQLQGWFPHLKIVSFPSVDEVDLLIKKFDKIVICYDSKCPFIAHLIERGKKTFFEKVKVFNPSFAHAYWKIPYYEDSYFDPKYTIVENFKMFSEKILLFEKTTTSNGIVPPGSLVFKKHSKRVVIHPMSASHYRMWSSEKYIRLARHLKVMGFDPALVMTEKEKELWISKEKEDLPLVSFNDFDSLARFIYESGFMIGNDSGVGHLASNLGITTLSLFPSRRSSRLWKPGWSQGVVLAPPRWIPNLALYRLRDKLWRELIPLQKVVKTFDQLVEASSNKQE